MTRLVLLLVLSLGGVSTASAEAWKGSVAALPVAGLTPSYAYPGRFDKALRWTDRSGTHTAIFSSTKTAFAGNAATPSHVSQSLHVSYYRQRRGRDQTAAYAPTLLRRVSDRQSHCEDDSGFGLEHKSIRVSDVDGDGLTELSFGYVADSCKTDMSEDGVKLVLLEGKTKRILRGKSMFDVDKKGGFVRLSFSVRPGPAKHKWSRAHHRFAMRRWAEFFGEPTMRFGR